MPLPIKWSYFNKKNVNRESDNYGARALKIRVSLNLNLMYVVSYHPIVNRLVHHP
jgi:hypothetical protein